MSFLGQSCKIESISTLDLQNYKGKLQSSYASVHRLNLNTSVMKAMFHWARRNDVLDTIPNIDAISKGKIVHQEMYTFNPEQIKKLLSSTIRSWTSTMEKPLAQCNKTYFGAEHLHLRYG